MLKNLVPLNLPEPPLKLAKKGNQPMVWDPLRKKYLVLTPEEWVRQHLVFYLQQELGVPASAIALEGGFKLNQKLQRTDVLVYKNSKPVLLVECKAPQVKIKQATFDQAARYNLNYQVDYLLLSNGLVTIAAQVDMQKGRYFFLEKAPHFKLL
jgi:predicted type IV restriction endonuclease